MTPLSWSMRRTSPGGPEKLTLLVAGGTDASHLARERHHKVALAVGAANASEASFQDPTIQEPVHRFVDHTAQLFKGGLEALVVDLQEGLEVVR